MADRITLSQIFSQGLRGLLSSQSQLYKTQNQISSGQRVLTPSDDPVAAAQILQLGQAQANIDQYKKNIDGATSSLQFEDGQLGNVTTLLTRVRELAIQAGNGSLTTTDRQAIAAELQSRLQELGELANTRNAAGEYIFGGYQGEQAPFFDTGAGYVYRGDDGQRSVQISSSTYVPVNDNGNDIFMAVPSIRLPTSAAATNTGDATIAMGSITDKAQFGANFNGPYSIAIDTTATPPTYQVDTVPAGPTPVATGNFVSGEPIEFNGAQVKIIGTPGNGDTFTVNRPSTQSTFETLQKLVSGLQSLSDLPDDKLRVTELISETLDNLDSAQAQVSVVRAKVGARLNTLDSTGSLQDGVGLVNQKMLSQVRDLDYATAITQLTQENVVLQAAQQSFAKISNLSLFDFLK